MEELRRQQIADFIKETTSLVVEWGFDTSSLQTELQQLHEIIGQLMQARFRSQDIEAKGQIADLENRARDCRELIIRQSLS